MKKYFYFSAIVCVLLFIFVLFVDATDLGTVIDNLWKAQDDKKTITQNKNMKAIEARIVMSEIATYYNLNAQEINKGKRMTLGSVLKGAATVTVTYVSGGSTATVTVLSSIEPALKSLGLVGSINMQSDLESAYESAISELQSRISDASQAITDYLHAWDDYRYPVLNHNSQYHGSGSSPSDQAHGISAYLPPDLNTDMPKFRCPGGGCNITYKYPSSARTAHYAKCGTKDDPYNKYLKGCYKVFYTCNTTEKARHQPNDCGLEKWVRKNGVWSKTACTSDYRKCTQNSQRHATVLGTNQISMCGPASSSSSANKSGSILPSSGSSSASAGGIYTVDLTTSTPFSSVYWYIKSSGTSGLGSSVETDNGGSSSYSASMTYTFGSSDSGDYIITAYIYDYSDNTTYQVEHTVSVSGSSSSDETPNCSDCTSHCSSPCSCSNSGTCNGSVYTPPSTPSTPPTPPPTPSTPTIVACGGAAWTGCTASVSSRTEHKVSSCSNCGKHYWTCMPGAVDRHTEVKTCKRSGCGASLTRCQNGPGLCVNGGYHWL